MLFSTDVPDDEARRRRARLFRHFAAQLMPTVAEASDAALPAAAEFERLHRRLDVLERHMADLMFLQLSAQDLLPGQAAALLGPQPRAHRRGPAPGALPGPLPLLRPRARPRRGGPAAGGGRVRPRLPPRAEPARAWLAGLPALPPRDDPWRLSRALLAHPPVPRLPGRGARRAGAIPGPARGRPVLTPALASNAKPPASKAGGFSRFRAWRLRRHRAGAAACGKPGTRHAADKS